MYPDSSKNLNYKTDDAVYWFSSAYDPLNNWSAHAVAFWGKVFPTVEHGCLLGHRRIRQRPKPNGQNSHAS